MSEPTLRIVLWGLGMLFTIIGFFLSFYFMRIVKQQDETAKSINQTHQELSGSINKLQLAITGLNGVILSMQDKNETFTRGCSEKHAVIDKKLHDHEKQLNAHERKIVEFDIKINQ